MVCLLAGAIAFGPGAAAQDGKAFSAERSLAGAVSETRMVDAVRRLVGFGTRMYGTPSNHEAAAWLAGAFEGGRP